MILANFDTCLTILSCWNDEQSSWKRNARGDRSRQRWVQNVEFISIDRSYIFTQKNSSNLLNWRSRYNVTFNLGTSGDSIWCFIPCHTEKYIHSEYRKTVLYSTVLHPTIPSCAAGMFHWPYFLLVVGNKVVIQRSLIVYLTIILRNRAEYRLILSRLGLRRLKSDDIPRDWAG